MNQANISAQRLEEDTEVTQSNWPSAQWPVSPQWATGQFSSSVNTAFLMKVLNWIWMSGLNKPRLTKD